MSALATPFWIVTDCPDGVPAPVTPMSAPGYAAAFTGTARARAFMRERGEGNCDVALVTSRMLPSVVETYRLLGMRGFCVDPDGKTHATVVAFDDID